MVHKVKLYSVVLLLLLSILECIFFFFFLHVFCFFFFVCLLKNASIVELIVHWSDIALQLGRDVCHFGSQVLYGGHD